MYTIKDRKWHKLEDKLRNHVKENINENGIFIRPMKEVFEEFAKKNGTTTSSTQYYYYSKIRNEILNRNNDDIIDVEIVNNDNEEVNKIQSEIISLVGYIEKETDYVVSGKSLKLIEEMVKEVGAIETLVSIIKSIESFDDTDILYTIINEAKNNKIPF